LVNASKNYASLAGDDVSKADRASFLSSLVEYYIGKLVGMETHGAISFAHEPSCSRSAIFYEMT
jgi:hypothetical protein